jgi:glycosyltransferase involved in cell wall biosynthesis
MPTQKPHVSLAFPVYNDEATVETVTSKALEVLAELAGKSEVIIVDDGSPDRSGEIADELARRHDTVRVIHHGSNRGYGEAVKSALEAARYEWICLTDGDDEYDVRDLNRLIRHKDSYDLIITFRYVKLYTTFRVFVSWVYNKLVRFLFRTPYRDISTGLRLIRRSLVPELALQSASPFIGAEFAFKTMLKGYRVGEVGILTFPRTFGRGGTTTPRNIVATIRDMVRVYRTIFSNDYDLPEDRRR